MAEVVASVPVPSASGWAVLPPELVEGIARFLSGQGDPVDGSDDGGDGLPLAYDGKAIAAGRLTCRNFAFNLPRGVETIFAKGDPPARRSSPLLENVKRLVWDFRSRKYYPNELRTRCEPATEFLKSLRSLEIMHLWNTSGFIYMKDVVDALVPHGRIKSLKIDGVHYSDDTFLIDVSRLTSLNSLGLMSGPDLTEQSILRLSRLKGLQSLQVHLKTRNRLSCHASRFPDPASVLGTMTCLKSLQELHFKADANIDSALIAFSTMPALEVVSVEYERYSDRPGRDVLRIYSDSDVKELSFWSTS